MAAAPERSAPARAARVLLRPPRHAAFRGLRALLARRGLHLDTPDLEYLRLLEERAEYELDDRPIPDHRPTTVNEDGTDVTIAPEALAEMLDRERLRGGRVLEIGPKWGSHSLWIDRNLEPSELVFCDFAEDRDKHARWEPELRHPHRFVYGDLRTASDLLELEPFDLVLFCGVLYHSAHHIPLLGMLNRVTRLGGQMLLETTYDRRPGALVRLRWQAHTGKAKAVPTIDAVRLMLAWNGWRKLRRFTDYRPASSEAVFLCEKTDELVDDTDFAPIVRRHRLAQ
jgi:ubiquinone/menaquinone biosynthesis C-methylase UbiE